jgi:hypothetical protein
VSRPTGKSENINSRPARVSSDLITPKELQISLSGFLKAYETGNIKAMDKLFAKNIIFNKGTTKAEIRKDFIDLFSSSSKRKMNIRDIRWKYYKNQAKGIGTMNAVIVESNKQKKLKNGKIQFVMKKINNKVLITHLYQLSHN